LDEARQAAAALLGLLDLPDDHAAVVSFDETARTNAPLTGDLGVLTQALAGLSTTPNTHIDLGLAEARRLLEQRRWNATGVLVLLTDGLNNAGPAPVLAEGQALRAGSVLVYTVGLGPQIDEELLRAVATSPDGYFASPTAADLESIYRQIAGRLACDQP
jgi:Mg-chelatase subunit ChlD